jgi:hypothetical protein
MKRPLIIIGALIVVSLLACKETPPPNKSFRYWAMVQRMHDGKEYEAPKKFNDDATFASGDKFQLNVTAPESGYIYIFNEGPVEPANVNFRLIYPNKATNNGSAALGANQTVKSDWIVFRGPAGSENFWIVWSVAPIRELDVVKNEAFKDPNGALSESTLVTVKEFLKALQSRFGSKAWRYKATDDTVVRGRTDTLVMRAEFKHR